MSSPSILVMISPLLSNAAEAASSLIVTINTPETSEPQEPFAP